MAHPAHPDLDQEIADLERRMALRRDRLKLHSTEATDALKRKIRPVPIITTISLAAAGFLLAKLARSETVRDRIADRFSRKPWYAKSRDRMARAYDRHRYRYYDDDPRYAPPRRRASTLGKLAAIGAALLRFGVSPQGRFLWRAVNERRMRHAAYGPR